MSGLQQLFRKKNSHSEVHTIFYIVLLLCLVTSVCLYLSSPNTYNSSFCYLCLIVFLLSSGIMLFNNISRYKTLVLFEFLFVIAFFMTNYAYPVFLYKYGVYFSLFHLPFNENIMSKATAIATTGICAYNIGQFDNGIQFWKKHIFTKRMKPVTMIDKVLLIVFFLHFLRANVSYISSGLAGGDNSSFFMIFSIYLIFKIFKNEQSLKNVFVNNKFVLFVVLLYILLSFYIGNRGEPLYILMGFVICYAIFVHKISYNIFLAMIVGGLLTFYVIGEIRVSERSGYTTVESIGSRMTSIEGVDSYLMYGEQLIINARSLYVLVDYKDKNGATYGLTWMGSFCSPIPYLQGLVVDAFGFPSYMLSSGSLNTYLYFGKGDPDKFGLGTNIIGDIYLCFGYFGVIIFMFLLGLFVRYMYVGTIRGDTTSQLIYCCLFLFCVYYTRAVLFTPLRTTVWVYLLYRMNIKKISYKV